MLKWILRVFFAVILIVIVGSLGYLYVMSEEVVSPDTPTIELQSVIDENIADDDNQQWLTEKKHLLSRKHSALEYQASLLEEKKSLLQKRQREIEQYILNESDKIRDRYQKKIDLYQEQTGKDYQEFAEEKNQEYQEQMMVKQELYKNKLNELVKSLEESSLKDMESYKQEVIKKYYRSKIDYDLKIKVLDLSEKEKEGYSKKLAELKEEYLSLIESRESTLISEIENQINEFEVQYNEELAQFQQELSNNIEESLDQRRSENQRKVEEYLHEQQLLMDEEIERRSSEIRGRSNDEIYVLENLINDISQKYYSIQMEISILEKEVMY
ncbi:MAG: hypothetical protein ACOCQW_00505 [Halanaerobiaceae bacterium]